MLKKVIAAAALTLLASTSFAAPTGGYAGLDIGSTKIDDLGGNKTSFGGLVGYGVNQYFAAEVGYRHLGKWDVDGIGVSAKQTHVSLVGSYPLTGGLDVYGRLGYSHVRASASYGGVTVSASGSDPLYGLGLHYSFSDRISGRFEVQKPTSDSTNVGIAAIWKF